MLPSAIAVLAGVALLSTSAATPLKVLSTVQLSGELAEALDVRWTGEDQLILAAARNGVFRCDTHARTVVRIIGNRSPDGFFYSSRVAASSSYIVPGSPFAALAWLSTSPRATLSPQFPFDMILDLDLYGDTLAVLGARRADDGRWAPEGGIVWVGSLSKNLKDLRPVHYSESGAGAKALDRCHFFNTGAIRFLRDGTLLVVPGVETGMYLYERSGKLLRTWDTAPIGFFDRCEFTEKQAHEMAIAPTATWNYLNARTILDDVIPLPGGDLGFFTRRFDGQRMHYTLSVVREGKLEERIALPFTGGERSFVRADVRGRKIALLLIEYAAKRTPDGARLAILEFAP